MFFQGSLQEGIASALQQSKFVVCFVTGEIYLRLLLEGSELTDLPDNGDESRQWEDEFLADEPVSPARAYVDKTSPY
jgi:hypothetical protein